MQGRTLLTVVGVALLASAGLLITTPASAVSQSPMLYAFTGSIDGAEPPLV
jgi:hypothetical protein